jgi:hypothetical protein
LIRVQIPAQLRVIAGLSGELSLEVEPPITPERIIDSLEEAHPSLKGTVRDPLTGRRRPRLRFFVCETDVSFAPLDAELPAPIAAGDEPFMIVGAVSGG